MMSVMKPMPAETTHADAVLVKFFQNQSQHDRAPADEDGGGIEIGHRRPAFQHHAINQARRVNQKRQPDQPDGRTAQSFRQIEPRKNREQSGEDVNDHRVVKRLHLVEEDFRARFCQRLGMRRHERWRR